MNTNASSTRRFRALSGISVIAGVLLLGCSFAINNGPPPDAGPAELLRFIQQHSAAVLAGAWMQALGPFLIVLFALALVHLAGAASRLSGWMTFFGAAILMTVSLIEITFYIAGLNPGPAALPGALPFISLKLISAVQHLYFFIAAPALFCPLGLILVRSCVLPRVFGYLALVLAVAFASLGVIYLRHLTLPDWVTSFAAIQALWWLAASIALIAGRSSVPDPRK